MLSTLLSLAMVGIASNSIQTHAISKWILIKAAASSKII